jgi:hypothetical protein
LITKVPDGGGRYNTPPSLILAAWTAYKAAQEASLAAPATELVQVRRGAGGGTTVPHTAVHLAATQLCCALRAHPPNILSVQSVDVLIDHDEAPDAHCRLMGGQAADRVVICAVGCNWQPGSVLVQDP